MALTKKSQSFQVLIPRDITTELRTGNLDRRVPMALGVTWVDFERYDQDSLALLAQQQLASRLLMLLHPTADGRLRVSKRKLAALFNKIGVGV